MKSSDCRLYRYPDSTTRCFIVYYRRNAEIRATFQPIDAINEIIAGSTIDVDRAHRHLLLIPTEDQGRGDIVGENSRKAEPGKFKA